MNKVKKQNKKQAKKKGSVPIFIGITGHRDIPAADHRKISSSIRAIFDKLRNDYPHSRIQLLSMLASGADSIAAETAIDAGIEVIAVLPFHVDLYRKDFEGADLEHFESLYAKCVKRYTMPYLPGASKKKIGIPGFVRDKQYAYGGAFVSRYSNVLIAVWDGLDPQLKGGTADILRMQLHASPNEYMVQPDFLSGRQSGPVYWIYTRRERHTETVSTPPENLPFECLRCQPSFQKSGSNPVSAPYELLYPSGWVIDDKKLNNSCQNAGRYYDKIMASLDDFNKDVLRGVSKKKLKNTGELYDCADQSALFYQKKTRRSIKYLLILGNISFFLMSLFGGLFTHAFTLFGFFVSLACTWIYYRRMQSKNIDGKYYDYRSLAEIVRVMTQLDSVGVYVDPVDLITTKQQSLLPWICSAARNCLIDFFFEKKDKTTEACSALLTNWVKYQQEYHMKAGAKREKEQNSRKFFRFLFFILAILTAVSFIIVRCMDVNSFHTAGSNWFDFSSIKYSNGYLPSPAVLLQLAFDLFLSIGAALALYMHLCAFKDEILLFTRASIIFKRASLLMSSAIDSGDVERFTALAMDLAREAVSENFEWNAVHRSIPLEMPMG